jgi:hypothetical protein
MAASSGRLVDPDGLFPNTGWLRRWRGCVVADYAGLDSRHPRRLLNDAAPQSRDLGDRGIDVLDADEEGHQRTPSLERTNHNDDQQTPKSTWFDSNPVGRRQALVGDPSRTNQ